MNDLKIWQIFEHSYGTYPTQKYHLSDIQQKAARTILDYKPDKLSCSISQCSDYGHMQIHNNPYRNRSCPNCQAVLKEAWIDKHRAEVIDSPYFHAVLTFPHKLNPPIYCNQKLLRGLLHRYRVETLLELSAGREYLGAQPGIIQVLHTWNQELDYHIHMYSDRWDIMIGEIAFS